MLAFAKDVLARDERLFLADIGDLRELVVVQVFEDRDLLEQIGNFGHGGVPTTPPRREVFVAGGSQGEATGAGWPSALASIHDPS